MKVYLELIYYWYSTAQYISCEILEYVFLAAIDLIWFDLIWVNNMQLVNLNK